MPKIPCFLPAAGLRAICLTAALAWVACGSEPEPEPKDRGGDDSKDDDPATATGKDASTRKPDAGKVSAKTDASISDPGQIKPMNPPVKEPQPIVDAGSTVTTPPTKPDAGSTMTMTMTPSGDAGMSVSGLAAADLEMLRQVCVDEINMYRATLMLGPMARPTPQHELCSDQGAQKDGIAKVAHGSAGQGNPCASAGQRGFPGFQAQNTCPGWPAASPAAIATALKGCLKQMWAEGEPPEGTDKCISDYFAGNTACFLAHGHYINMKGSSKKVSCGFFDMGKNTYWMNQDFL